MPWFRSLRDDLTLRPFEDAPSEDVAMASTSPPDVSTNQEPAEVVEECPGKKKSKFQTFKKFFIRRRRKAPPGGDELKCSVSSDDLSKSRDQTSLRDGSEKNNGAEVGLGSRAQSHDSVFASDWSENQEALGASQDSLHGKVKNLQMQLKQAMRLGAPPSLLCMKRTEDNGTVSEDDGLPCSPPDYTPSKSKPQRNSSISLDSAEEQSSCRGSRALSPLVAAPGDFSSPASVSVCLDSSAARHKRGLRQRAQQRRKPTSRSELRAKGDSLLDDTVNGSIADDTGVSADEELKVEDVEIMTELNSPEDSEETSTPTPIQNLDQDLNQESGEQDSPGSSPEPPAGDREHLLDSLRLSESSLEEKLGEALSEDEEGDGEREEEKREAEGESSLLLEVLSSLKTPLAGLDVPLTDHQRETEEKEGMQWTEETEEQKEMKEREGTEVTKGTEWMEEPEGMKETEEQEGTDETEMEEAEDETLEESVQPETPEETQNDITGEDQEVEAQPQEVKPEQQELETDIQEVDVSFYRGAEDEVKSVEEESEELEVEHFKPNELVPEKAKEDYQVFSRGSKIVSVTQYSDSEDEEMQYDLNVTEKQSSELHEEEEVDEILDSIEQDVTESEEEETQAAILVQEEKQEETDQGFEEETGENVEIEAEIETQMSAEVVKIEEDFEVGEELITKEMDEFEKGKEQKESEDDIMIFEEERVRIEQDDEEEAVSREREEGDLTICEMSPSKTSTATLEINLVSPTAEKHVRFSDGFTANDDLSDQTEETQEEESEQTSMEEMEDMQEVEHLEMIDDEEQICDEIEDESVSFGEIEKLQKQDGSGIFEREEVDILDKTLEEKTMFSENEKPDMESIGKFEKDFDIVDKIEDVEVVEAYIAKTKEFDDKLKEEVEILDKAQEDQEQRPLHEVEKCENVDVTQENPEKQASNPEPSRPRFTVATAWQRSLSIGEKDSGSLPTAPNVDLGNHKVTSESKPDPEFQQVQESSPGQEQSQESRSETQQVESRHETQQVQDSTSKADTQQIQESRPEIQQVSETQIQESKGEPGPETIKENPAGREGVSQNPFGVRLRRTQALQRFIAEDEHKQDVLMKKAEPPSSFALNPKPVSLKLTTTGQPITAKTPLTNPPITAKTPLTNPPITAKTSPTNPPITVKTPPTNPPVTVKTPPTNPPIPAKILPPNPPVTMKPLLSHPITNKPTTTTPPISAKPVVPRKPEAETVNKLKRSSDAGSEPPSWISMAKHKQKVYKENSPVTSKDETEKKTQESNKVISLNLKPASPLSPPTPVPPVAPKSSHSCPALAPVKPLSPSPPPAASARPTTQSPGPASPPSPPPRVTSPQEEPPWMALAKKKAKAWSEMPQIVQ